MDDAIIPVHVKCGSCAHSLQNPRVTLDELPSIDLEARILGKRGHVFLSQLYGSFVKLFAGVEDAPGSVAEFSCPHCHAAFPRAGTCTCGAPTISLALEIGGTVRICTRNGCHEHALEFEDQDDVFRQFEAQEGQAATGGYP